MIRIFIADDHPLVREGLKRILRDQPDIQVVGEAENAAEVLDRLDPEGADLLLLDISMPGRNGLDVLMDLKARAPRVRVLVLSMHPEDRFALRAIKSGASGYITKDSAADEMVNAIRKVHAGGKYISGPLAEKMASELQAESARPPHERLSDREFEIFRMLASAKSPSAIARELSLSLSTVNTYRGRILEKMSMKSTAELMRYGIENNLLE